MKRSDPAIRREAKASLKCGQINRFYIAGRISRPNLNSSGPHRNRPIVHPHATDHKTGQGRDPIQGNSSPDQRTIRQGTDKGARNSAGQRRHRHRTIGADGRRGDVADVEAHEHRTFPLSTSSSPTTEIVSDLIVREAVVRKLKEDRLRTFILNRIKPLMTANELLMLDMEIEVVIEESIGDGKPRKSPH